MSIKVEHINKSFKIFKREAGLLGAFKSFFNRRYEYVEAIKDISLTIDKGEIIGILGENGAGKTTLIKILAGLIHPTNGKINVNGFIPSKRKNNFLKKIVPDPARDSGNWFDSIPWISNVSSR